VSKPVVMLCEDVAQQNFVRRLVHRRGYINRDVYAVALPIGRGAGDKHVLLHYPKEVGSVRAESGYRRRCLVATIDADRYTVDQRHSQLDEALTSCQDLREDHRQPRGPQEPIAVFVPKWHIETWIDYLLDGGPVSEDAPSPRHRRAEPRECQDAADRLLRLAGEHPVPADCPASLQRGLGELSRVPPK
jgi:hypothetical protein